MNGCSVLLLSVKSKHELLDACKMDVCKHDAYSIYIHIQTMRTYIDMYIYEVFLYEKGKHAYTHLHITLPHTQFRLGHRLR